jgi:hypothetical protein
LAAYGGAPRARLVIDSGGIPRERAARAASNSRWNSKLELALDELELGYRLSELELELDELELDELELELTPVSGGRINLNTLPSLKVFIKPKFPDRCCEGVSRYLAFRGTGAFTGRTSVLEIGRLSLVQHSSPFRFAHSLIIYA